jgi:hypothetical protein
MPLIFGAFGNFLLPTQLGVHDVAFPRLNSAAFWFLPGGLIMLMQLVCVDRRYNRMNCFNIRELQGILKRKFFTDLVNSADHREILSSSMIGLRFKTNNNLNLDYDLLSFFKLGTNNTNKFRGSNYSNSYTNASNKYDYSNYFTSNNSTSYFDLSSSSNFLLVIPQLLSVSFISSFYSLFSMNSISNLFHAFTSNFFFNVSQLQSGGYNTSYLSNPNEALTFQGKNNEYSLNKNTDLLSEQDSLLRFSRFSNSTVSYDYKCGNYLGS